MGVVLRSEDTKSLLLQEFYILGVVLRSDEVDEGRSERDVDGRVREAAKMKNFIGRARKAFSPPPPTFEHSPPDFFLIFLLVV